jgi:phage gp29-like protein
MVNDPMGPPPPDSTVPKPGGDPDRRRFSSVPPIWVSGIDRVPDIEGALYGLQVGNFRQPALLADAVLRDDRISAVMDTRAGVIRGSDVEVKPANDSAKAEKVATILGGDEATTGIFEDLLPAPQVADLLQYGWLNAIAVAEVVWTPDTDTGMWTPRLVPVHPQFVYWDWGYNCYRLILADGIISLPDVMANPYSDGKWFVWCPFGYQYAWRKALIKPLADLYLQRRWNARDWSRYNEKHGSPADIAYVPEDANEEDKEAYYQDVLNRGSDTAVMVPRRDGQGKDDGYGLGLLEASSRTYQSFQLQQEKIDNSIAILFWGQNLTTEVQKGAGSKAAEQGHQKVADIKTKDDAAIARVYRQQVLSWWAHHNFGDSALAPRVRYVVEPPTDEKEEGDGYKALGEGIQALKTASPKVDVDAMLDTHGVPMLTAEQLAEEQRQAQERMKSMTPPGTGGPPAPGGAGGAPAGGAPGGEDGGDGGEEPPDDEKKADEKKAAAKNTGDQVVGHREFAGFRIAIENRAGSVRRWFDSDGKQTGETAMHHDYGYFEDHQGADGEELDVYLGPDEHAPDVYVVTQMAAPDFKRKDEQKVMAGFPSFEAAKQAYVKHRNDGDAAIGGILAISMDRFRAKLRRRRSGGHVTARDDGDQLALLVVRKVDGKWFVFSEEGKKLSKGYPSKAAAEKRLGEIEYFKHKKVTSAGRGVATLSARTVKLSGTRGRRQKLYADHVAASSHRSAVRAMSASLHRVMTAIKATHSFEDLKKRLAVEFKGMRPNEFAKVVAKARIMAKAGGMDTAWQQV